MRYNFVLRGRLGDILETLLRPVSVDVRADSTQVVVDLQDDTAVYGAVDRLERLGMSIISFAQESSPADEVDAE